MRKRRRSNFLSTHYFKALFVKADRVFWFSGYFLATNSLRNSHRRDREGSLFCGAMKWSPTRGKKPVNPDDVSGVYHKGLRPKNRSYAGGGNSPKVSEKKARMFGRALLSIITAFWGTVASYFVIDWINPGVLKDGPYSELFGAVFGLLLFLTGLSVVAFFFGEMMMRREFPQRNWILGLSLGPVILIVVGTLLYALGTALVSVLFG